MASQWRPPVERAPTWVVGVVAVGLVALVGIAAAAGTPVASSPFVGEPVTAPPGTAVPTDADPGRLNPADNVGWLGYLVGGMILLTIVVMAVMIVVLTIRMFSGRNIGLLSRRVLDPEELEMITIGLPEIDLAGQDTPVTEAVDQALVDVELGQDVRAGIIAAWLRLEDTAARVGTPRRATDAPDDLVQRLLAAHEVGPRRLNELAELYRRARFSPAPLGEADRAAALRALTAVRADLLDEPLDDGDTISATRRWPTRWS